MAAASATWEARLGVVARLTTLNPDNTSRSRRLTTGAGGSVFESWGGAMAMATRMG
jgi:hypothetical protein